MTPVRIVAARVVGYDLSFRRSVVTARTEAGRRRGLLVRLVDDDGVVGWGEAAPWPGSTLDDLEGARVALEQWAAGLPISAPFDLDRHAPSIPLERVLQPSPTARAAVDTALLDLAAHRAGLPLARLLTDQPATALASNGLVDAATPQAAVVAAAALATAGHATVKLKVGVASAAADVSLVGAVRAAVGPSVRLRLDANGAWSFDTASEVLGGVASMGVEYVEDPTADPRQWPELRQRTGVALAADTPMLDPELALRIVGEAWADVVVLKPGALGGPRVTLALARRANLAGLGVVVTTLMDAAVGRAAAVHVAASVPEPEQRAHGLATGDLLAEDVAPGIDPAGPRVVLPARPGLGVDPDETGVSPAR